MTDNEIIKALECCSGLYRNDELIDCCGCAFETDGLCCENCSDGILKASLDLINRQKAEIERLKAMNQAKLDMIHDLQAENEEQDKVIINALKRMGEIRAEAIKEFAERLKKEIQDKKYKYVTETNYSKTCNAVIDSCVVCIDNLVKEMIGE